MFELLGVQSTYAKVRESPSGLASIIRTKILFVKYEFLFFWVLSSFVRY